MTTLKQAVGPQYTRILSYGAARGDLVVPNADLIEAIDSSDEWIRQRTGIITRKRASKGLDAIDLAETASLEAIKNAGIDASEIGAVLVATISNVAVTPSMSSLLADRIGA
ncbi:MAG: 3-oxoacyl-[acyl-carrier-protein] synthase-III, partial [Schumannella sp.]|nr:3-oxoacyl-[acyl-carrier-protein] synthase-III [Schumannella sp.]